MEVFVDVRWLLEIQEARMTDLAVRDYSALVAAVARHRVNTPAFGAEYDEAWRAAALMHTIIQLRPLPARNALLGAMAAVAYMTASGHTLNAPYAPVELARDIVSGKADVFTAAERIRSWRA